MKKIYNRLLLISLLLVSIPALAVTTLVPKNFVGQPMELGHQFFNQLEPGPVMPSKLTPPFAPTQHQAPVSRQAQPQAQPPTTTPQKGHSKNEQTPSSPNNLNGDDNDAVVVDVGATNNQSLNIAY